jgi:uncharacterized protein (TIGR00369 family)
MNGGAEATAATRLSQQLHDRCFVCDAQMPDGLKIDYQPTAAGDVVGQMHCPVHWQGYAGQVHGGIMAAILDGAMTHALFARGIAAVTGDLRVRYRRPLRVGATASVTARVERASDPLFILSGELKQNGQLVARAEAKFMRRRCDLVGASA